MPRGRPKKQKKDETKELLDSIQPEPDEKVENISQDNIPEMGSYDWHQYVMSQFKEDELQNDNPTVDGLRRVVELLIGEIVLSESTLVSAPTVGYDRACVSHRVVLSNGHEHTDLADSYWRNTDKKYREFPVAVASTRAEGRVLRKILKLRKVVAAEEHNNMEIEDDGFIKDEQIVYLDTVAKNNYDLNVPVFLQEQYEISTLKQFKKMKRNDADGIFRKLGELQTSGMPEKYLGYNANWKEEMK